MPGHLGVVSLLTLLRPLCPAPGAIHWRPRGLATQHGPGAVRPLAPQSHRNVVLA